MTAFPAAFLLYCPRRGLLVRLERAEAAAPPACEGIAETFALAFNLFLSLLPASQLIGQFEEGAEQGGAIVVDQIDEAGLLHQAAEFDELPGAGAALLHPVAGI